MLNDVISLQWQSQLTLSWLKPAHWFAEQINRLVSLWKHPQSWKSLWYKRLNNNWVLKNELISYSNHMPSFPSKYHNIDEIKRKTTQLKLVSLSLEIQIKLMNKLFEYNSFIKHYMLELSKIDKYASFQYVIKLCILILMQYNLSWPI